MNCAVLFIFRSTVGFNLFVQQWLRVPRCYQPDLVTNVWYVVLVIKSVHSFLIAIVADMINIFEVFLPQLLRYPNPNDPLNGEAAALLMRHPKEYEGKVKGAT
jgi:hypothetical protein